MKILMTADTIGGVWSYALELAAALGETDAEIELATRGAPLAPDQRAAVAGQKQVRLHETSLKLEWMEDPWDDLRRASDWLLELTARLTPDLVHLNDFTHGALDFGAPVVVVGHSCVLSWWRAVRNEPAPASWNRYRAKVAEGLGGADAIVAPSAAMLASLQADYAPRAPGRVIHNGRSRARFAPGRKEPFILAAGRLWDEGKNLGALARVAPGLPWPVRFAGDPRAPDRQRPRFSGELLGRLSSPELAGWLGRASIYALPALYEPFGLSILEAALSGCALVLGDLPSLRELWSEDAVFVPPRDEGALAAALHELIERPERRAALAHRAFARARRYAPARMAAAYLRLYRELTGLGAGEEASSCGS